MRILLQGCIVLGVALGLPPIVYAEEYLIEGPHRDCSAIHFEQNDVAELTLEKAKELIQMITGGLCKDRYYIIHVVVFKYGTTYVKNQKWHIYHHDWEKPPLWQKLTDTNISDYFNETRIFGSTDIELVYVHLNAQEFVLQSNDTAILPYLVHLDRDKFDLINLGLQQRHINNAFTQIQYQITTTGKTASNVQNLVSLATYPIGPILSIQTLMLRDTPKLGSLQSIHLCGSGKIPIRTVPSNIEIMSFHSDDNRKLSKQTFDNEKRHLWDVSFSLPLKQFRDLQFDKNANEIVPREIRRQNLFAMVNLYLPPVNLKKVTRRFMPHLLYGLPIQGRIFDRHLVGLGFGLNFVQPFVGVTFDRIPGAQGQDRWVRKFTYGINIPVRYVVNALQKTSND